MNKKTFNITVTMEERWINNFCSMLKEIERFSNVGHSGIVAFFADGDGDFKSTFDIHTNYDKTEPKEINIIQDMNNTADLYDAG